MGDRVHLRAERSCPPTHRLIYIRIQTNQQIETGHQPATVRHIHRHCRSSKGILTPTIYHGPWWNSDKKERGSHLPAEVCLNMDCQSNPNRTSAIRGYDIWHSSFTGCQSDAGHPMVWHLDPDHLMIAKRRLAFHCVESERWRFKCLQTGHHSLNRVFSWQRQVNRQGARRQSLMDDITAWAAKRIAKSTAAIQQCDLETHAVQLFFTGWPTIGWKV